MCRAQGRVAALGEEAPIKGAEFVLLRIEQAASFEIDVGKPQISAAAMRLVPNDGPSAGAIHPEAIAVAEQIPAIPEIFVIAVGRRADSGAASLPFAGDGVDAIGEQADLRAPFEHRNKCALGRGAVTIVAGRAA